MSTTENIKLSKVTWKGIVLEVEYDLFTMMIREWIKSGWTRDECLDFIFIDCNNVVVNSKVDDVDDYNWDGLDYHSNKRS